MDCARNLADAAGALLPRGGEPFGHALRRLWTLDPDVHFLNHGSYGACPRHVLNRQSQWRALMEKEPVRFMNDILPQALREARDALAEFVGATPQNLVFVENATDGVNAVLRSLDWRAGETIVLANHAYPAVRNTAHFLARRHGLRVLEADIPWPLTDAGAIVDAYVRAISAGARVAVVDHVFSPLAVQTPLESIARACRSQGVMLVVDGAHAPALLPLELDALAALGVDCYTGNAHKWLCAPKGCGFLHATPAAQSDLHPTVISNYYGGGFEMEFAWTGTGDPSARLAVPAAIEFMRALGVERYRTALRALAREAAELVAECWKVRPGAPPESCAAMVTLPLPVDEAATAEAVARWRLKFLNEHATEVPVFAINGRLWVRLSAQVYNEIDDYRPLARALAADAVATGR